MLDFIIILSYLKGYGKGR